MKRIIVQRTGMLGDVICTTPIVRRLAIQYPDATITVRTGFPDVYQHNPCVRNVNPLFGLGELINLDLAYENRPHMHIAEAYMETAFGGAWREGEDWSLVPNIFLPPSLINSQPKVKNMVAVHAAVAGWKNRTLPRATWHSVITQLHDIGCLVALVGTSRDIVDPTIAAKCVDYRDASFFAQCAAIRRCATFAGSDSGMLHAASAMGVGLVGVYTATNPALFLPRQDQYPAPTRAVITPVECWGCRHRQPPGQTLESCERDALYCVQAIQSEAIINAVREVLSDLR